VSTLGVMLLAAGGAAGTLARFGVVQAVKAINPDPPHGGQAFPWGTLAVNMVGCLAIGLLAPGLIAAGVREDYRTAVVVGLLGGFTTYSSFAWESHQLWTQGRPWAAASYVAASVVGGLALAFAGAMIAGPIFAKLATR